MSFDLRAVREELPSARASAYLNAGTFGPLPRAAAQAMHAHVDGSFERGRIGMAGINYWLGLMDRARAAFARSLSAPIDDVALTHCTTDGCNTVLWGLPFEPGDEIVTTSHEHPGLTAPLDELARTRGVVVRVAEPTLDALVAACGPRTRVLAISHVLWTNGDVLPVREIVDAVRAKNLSPFVLVDGAQSVGAIPVVPSELGVDAYTVSGQKWLCGPSGTGALWVRKEALSLLGTAWPSYFSMQRGAAGPTDWASARRLDGSTVGMTSLAGLCASLEFHQGVVQSGGLEVAARMADSLRAKLSALPNVRMLPAARPSQLVSFFVDGESANAVSQRLESMSILVRPIPDADCVRASVGFWNDESDLDRLVMALEKR